MGREPSYLAELVRINDTLIWSQDRTDSFVAAVEIVRDLMGARIAPTYLQDEAGNLLVLVTDDETRDALGPHFATMPAHEHVRPPWINPQEWPVSAADHLQDPAWRLLPDDFKAWFGESGVVVSIHADGRHLGAVLLCFDGPWALTATRKEFLAAVGRILGNAVYRWQVAGRERELGALEERRRLSDELHVDLSQQLAAIGLHAGVMELDAAARDVDRLVADVEHLEALVATATRSLRHQMLGLRADAEMVKGTFAAQVRRHVDNFERQFGVPVAVECAGGADDVPLPVAAQLIRVLQEALANVHLHARATAVTVRLLPSSTRIRLEVEDDGNGFDPTSVPDSRLGVRIMSERMQQVDGVVTFGRGHAGGTLVAAEAPLRRAGSTPAMPSRVEVGT